MPEGVKVTPVIFTSLHTTKRLGFITKGAKRGRGYARVTGQGLGASEAVLAQTRSEKLTFWRDLHELIRSTGPVGAA